MTYQKDGATYQTEIVPKSDGADASYVKIIMCILHRGNLHTGR